MALPRRVVLLWALVSLAAPFATASGAGCANTCAAGQYRKDDCSCVTCSTCASGKYVEKTCDEQNNLVDTKCTACTTSCGADTEGRPRWMSTKCAVDANKKVNAACSTCTDCCPLVGTPGSGITCKKTSSKCSEEKDAICGFITDWEGFVSTGTGCGNKCGQDTGDEYTSKDTTWAFIITDKNDDLVFQGLPNVTSPCAANSKADAMKTCKNKALSESIGTSSGFVPQNVKVLPAIYTKEKNSWCMERFCMHSKSAGVKFEYNPVPEIDKSAANKLAIWMNPQVSGACGGKSTEWSFELTGPMKGTC